MTVQVRPAGLADVAAIVAFGSSVVPPHYAPILGEAVATRQLAWWTAERMSAAVEARRVYVATDGDALVGVSETGELAGRQVIWKLYLAPDHRGRSLGPELLRHAIAGLPVDCDQVFVEHVAGNTRAAAFYEREGFEIVKIEPGTADTPEGAIVWRRREIHR
ncbi:MAG: GNAT family N-acetyltransferase [Nocardioides sp.]|mgnify:CR=1 FL=1|nr:GNAT family N-acetyltransferase [Nocardioidaceae bacterium]MCB8957029.1 GNAT family N-acetyltransferase [Nocardioides sp.]